MSNQDPFADQEKSNTSTGNQNVPPLNQSPNSYSPGSYQIPLPNATGALVLGICSIVGAICYGIPGLVCAIIGLVLSNGGEKLYKANPEKYTTTSYNNLKAGRITSIIGLALSGLMLLIVVIYAIFVATMVSSYSYF